MLGLHSITDYSVFSLERFVFIQVVCLERFMVYSSDRFKEVLRFNCVLV